MKHCNRAGLRDHRSQYLSHRSSSFVVSFDCSCSQRRVKAMDAKGCALDGSRVGSRTQERTDACSKRREKERVSKGKKKKAKQTETRRKGRNLEVMMEEKERNRTALLWRGVSYEEEAGMRRVCVDRAKFKELSTYPLSGIFRSRVGREKPGEGAKRKGCKRERKKGYQYGLLKQRIEANEDQQRAKLGEGSREREGRCRKVVLCAANSHSLSRQPARRRAS